MKIRKSAFAVQGVLIMMSVALMFFPVNAAAAPAGNIQLASDDGGGGMAVNLTLQQMTVSPIRAFVGDTINVDVVVDNREDGSDTAWVEIYANKKKVAQQMFRWGGPGMERTHRISVPWNTTGFAPGEYTLRVNVFVFQDISPFDNDHTMDTPVILVAPGGEFPGGAQAGGSITYTDSRYK